MKKLLTFFTMALLAFAVGWADEVSVTFSDLYSANTVLTDVTIPLGNDVTITFAKPGGTAPQYYTNGYAVRWYARNTMTVASTKTITNIVLTFGNSDGSNAITTDLGSYSNGTWTGSASSVLFTVGGTSGHRRLSAVTVTYSDGGTTVAAPTISPAGGDFLTSQEVTLSHADGGTIYYTLDGSDPTESSTLYSAPFTLTETTTVKAIAVKNGVSSSIASATFTRTGKATIAEALALEPGNSSNFTFTGNAVVTASTSGYLWIRDNTGSGVVYNSNYALDPSILSQGTVLSPNWQATRIDYYGLKEFRTNYPETFTANGTQSVEPFVRTTITADNMNEYVSISELTITGSSTVNSKMQYTTAEGITLYDFFNLANRAALTTGKKYNVTGVVNYNTSNSPNVRLYLLSATEVASSDPTLLVNPNPLTINDSGTGNTFTVEGSNLGSDNVGLTQNGSYFTPTLATTTGWSTDGGTYWYFTPNNGSLNGTVAMNYTGRELSASETVTLANNKASATVTVNYRADVYILGNYGSSGWDYSNGILMTYDATNNTYTASVTADVGDLIVFARKLGESNPWNSRILFGPNSNGDWWVDSSPNPKEGTIDLNDDDPIYFNCAGTFTIEINATTGAITVTREVVNTGDFELVTAASQLNAGDEVIIVNSGSAGSAKAMSTTQNSNNRGATDVTVSNSLKVTATESTQIFTLEATTGGWYFKTVNGTTQGYIYAASSSGNQLKTEATPDANGNAKAAIDIISGNVADIVFQGTNSRNVLQYNTGSDIFSCYGSASQEDVYLYRRTASTEPSITVNPSSLELVIPAGGSSQSGNVTVTESNTTGTTIVTINGDTNIFSASLNNGTLTVTYSGTATQANPDQATITLTNGTATATVTVTGYKLPLTVTITPSDGHTFQGSTVSGIIESNVDDATIEYSFDGTNWETYDANEGFTATVNSVGGTVTVYARATYNGETATAQATYTRVAEMSTCTADIVFAPKSNNGEMSQWSTFVTHIGEGTDYLSSGTVSKLWTNTAYNAMRFGSGNYTGELAMTLDLSKFEGGACKLSRVIINAARYGSDGENCHLKVSTNVNTTGVTLPITADQDNFADYVFNFNGDKITSLTIENTSTSNGRVYVHSISLEYYCTVTPTVEAPVITPATGTYYDDQTVNITAGDGCTIYYTTDGSDPTTSSTVFAGDFSVSYNAGSTTTIKAIAVDGDGNLSEVTTVVYTWGAPTVHIHPDSRNTTASSVTVTLTPSPAEATIYYTTDGSTPSAQNGTEYTGAFSVALDEIGDQVTVKAIAVYGDATSDVATATYTRVEKVLEVNAPFFSPLQNNTYYGDQTLQIATTTPNADIYYEIVEVSGTTAPSASSVEDPTHTSTYYDGTPYQMTVGNSYYVKAIAYIGNNPSTIAEGWYIIEAAPTTQYYYTNLKDFNDHCPTGVTAHFVNPVQVVYHSTYTNNGEYAEFCYLRDNTDYACVYFGKRDTHDYTIFKMGDWIDGSQIAGVTNIWERNFHIQLGTGNHEVTSWPTTALGWNEIIPEEITNDVIVAGTAEGSNSWGHYVHLRNTRLSGVQDYSANDPKHTGMINDGTADAYYYDKFYRWSAGTCSYTTGGNTYTDQIQCLGDYDQAFFTAKQDAGATFDVYGVVDYYSQYTPPFEMCPIDFLWAYKPVMNPATMTCVEPITVDITATHPEWAAEGVVIYYKTEDMEEWAVYDGPITVNSTTTIQAYAEVAAEKLDGTNYNDYVRSEVISETYTFESIKDPIIDPESQVIEIGTQDKVEVTVSTNSQSSAGTVTIYTTDGTVPTLETGIVAENGVAEFDVTETTTVTAISYLVLTDPTTGEETYLWSNPVSETYTFVEKNSVIYDLLTEAPVVGNVYVIVNKDAYMGMSTTQNANNRGSVGVMFTDNTKNRVYGNEDLAQFVLEQATAGRYYFKNINGDNTGYLVVTTNANANLNTGDEATTYAEAAVSVQNGNGYPATITFNYDGTTRYLRYYENGRTFSTYSDGTLNEEVYLYGLEATPLAYIESSIVPVNDINNITANDKQVIVSDELIGVWAVVNPSTGVNKLWAKDQGNVSIDKTSIVEGQADYVKDILKLQKRDWDQSNWVVLDFSGTGASAFDYESRKLKSMTVEGYYYDDLNYAIKLTHAPQVVDNNNVEGYPGYDGNYAETDGENIYYYNHYVPVNFMTNSLNAPYGDGAYAGPASSIEGTPLFFMNPKVQEIAQVWGVWMGNDRFDILDKGVDAQGNTINGFDLSGSFDVLTWDYNRLGTMGPDNNPEYGYPTTRDNTDALEVGQPYLFHVIITRRNYDYGHVRGAGATPDGSFGIMPADLPSGHPDPTAVKEMTVAKEVVSVRYYNIMGLESQQPFEGVNIVVTRYSDGSMSAVKVLK